MESNVYFHTMTWVEVIPWDVFIYQWTWYKYFPDQGQWLASHQPWP